MHARMRRLAATLVTALALGAAACGGDDENAPAGGGAEGSITECPDGAVVIAMRDVKFDPENATAKVGQEICWPNEDTIDHNAVAESGADFESELFGQGGTFTATVDEPGTVEYVCTIHPGMTGTIQVNGR
jgi:plastocyanin